MIARQRKRHYQRKLINKQQQQDTQDDTMVNEKQRWNKRKHLVNLKRRQSYNENPSSTHIRVNLYYSKNQSSV